MRTLVFGSLNIDRTYLVDHFVQAGETLSANKMEVFCGGKGFNQAIALSRAGSNVYFAGAIGTDGDILKDTLILNNIDVQYLQQVSGPSGHAVIQVDPTGQNCIIILAGANGSITQEYIDEVISNFGPGDLLLAQNEISNVDYVLSAAHSKGMIVAFNPSPFNEAVSSSVISCVDYLIINEVEGALISGAEAPEEMLLRIRSEYPNISIVLTLGSAGAVFVSNTGERAACGIFPLSVVDTTAAGDTFAGFFLTDIIAGADINTALKKAAIASGIAVSRKGASPSIPFREEVDNSDLSILQEFSKK